MSKFLGGSASVVYGQDTKGVQSLTPRLKFNFLVKIYYQGASKPLDLIRVSDAQMPGHVFKTSLLNAYNRKRLVNTGVDYSPVSITAYDTHDAEIEKFLLAYNRYYFNGVMSDPNNQKLGVDLIDDINNASGKGLKLVTDKYFINKIEIWRDQKGKDQNTITIYNPMITNISGDTLSYSESAPVQYRIDFNYESYDITTR
jgi:hypothetical protein